MTVEHYRAEELTEPFYFNRPTDTTDGAGGYTTVMARNPASGFHFAKVRPLRGTERLAADGLVSESSLLFVVHAGLGIRTTDTLVYAGLQYNVRSVKPNGRSIFQEIEAEAGEAL